MLDGKHCYTVSQAMVWLGFDLKVRTQSPFSAKSVCYKHKVIFKQLKIVHSYFHASLPDFFHRPSKISADVMLQNLIKVRPNKPVSLFQWYNDLLLTK